VTAAANKAGERNGFSQCTGFGNDGVITDNDPVEQEKTATFHALLANAVIFHNALDVAEIVRRLQEECHVVDPGDLAHISPYLTEHIRRLGGYSTHELGLVPEAYDPHLDVDFSPLRGDSPLGPAATAKRHDRSPYDWAGSMPPAPSRVGEPPINGPDLLINGVPEYVGAEALDTVGNSLGTSLSIPVRVCTSRRFVTPPGRAGGSTVDKVG
jgi:hypothetical protein